MRHPIHEKVLNALVAAGGQLTIDELRGLYEDKTDGLRVSYLNRDGLTEWIRPEHNPIGNAVGLRITDTGRAAAISSGQGRE